MVVAPLKKFNAKGFGVHPQLTGELVGEFELLARDRSI
jgi:hypothetical protein